MVTSCKTCGLNQICEESRVARLLHITDEPEPASPLIVTGLRIRSRKTTNEEIARLQELVNG